ncbi:MAG: hypothetical protein RL076_2785 [Chloroflexota bacterium]|jgi:hypothetical protein
MANYDEITEAIYKTVNSQEYRAALMSVLKNMNSAAKKAGWVEFVPDKDDDDDIINGNFDEFIDGVVLQALRHAIDEALEHLDDDERDDDEYFDADERDDDEYLNDVELNDDDRIEETLFNDDDEHLDDNEQYDADELDDGEYLNYHEDQYLNYYEYQYLNYDKYRDDND